MRLPDCTLAEPCGRAVCANCYPVEDDRSAWSIRHHRTAHDDEWVILRDGRWVASVRDQQDAEFIMRAYVIEQMASQYDAIHPVHLRSRRITAPRR